MKPLDKLVSLLKEDKVIPVVGAGVSYAAAALPGWKGFIESGLEYADDRKLDVGSQIKDAKEFLAKGELTKGASIMKKLLNAPNHPFADWLDDFLSNPKIISEELLNSINNLCTPIILTTNYDTLLYSTTKIKTKTILDWSQYEETAIALKKKKEILLHLHGVYNKPKTIILSSDDYELLNMNLGYKSILKDLWTNYHFLFIGCSKDGVMDDDFSTVVNFLNQWFPGVPNEHFILLNENDLEKGVQLELAKSCNVAAICYGSDYDAIPSFINGFNPNWEKLNNQTKELQDELKRQFERQLLDSSGKFTSDRSKISTFLKNELPNGVYWIDSVQFNFLEKIWKDYNKQINSKYEKFTDYQNLIKGLVDLSELDSKIDFWNKNRDNPSALNSKAFIELAVLAYECLNKFPKEILEDIRHRVPFAIHDYYFTGYLGGFVYQYIDLKKSGMTRVEDFYIDDKYFFENLKRILASLNAVLELDAAVLYKEVPPAVITPEIITPFLVFVTAKEITFRNPSSYSVFAKLTAEETLAFKDAQLIEYNDTLIIVGHTSKNCFYWNPRENLSAVVFFEGELMTDISQVISRVEGGNIETQIFCGVAVFLYRNFKKEQEIKLSPRLNKYVHFFEGKYWIGQKAFYNNQFGPFLFRIDQTTNQVLPIMTVEDLSNMVQDIPTINERRQNDKKDQISNWMYFRLQSVSNVYIKQAKFGVKEIFLLSCKVYIDNKDSTIIFGFNGDELTMLFRVCMPGKSCIAYDLIANGDNIDLVCGYLARGVDNPARLVQLFRSVNVNNDIVADENTYSAIESDGNAASDILSICPLPNNCVFAMQSDKVFHVNFENLSFLHFKVESYIKKIIPQYKIN